MIKQTNQSLFDLESFITLSKSFCLEQIESNTIEASFSDKTEILHQNPFYQKHDLLNLKIKHFEPETGFSILFYFFFDPIKNFVKMYFSISSNDKQMAPSLLLLSEYYDKFPSLSKKIEFGNDKVVIEIHPILKIPCFKLVNCGFVSDYMDLRLNKPNLVIAAGLHLKVFGIYLSMTK